MAPKFLSKPTFLALLAGYSTLTVAAYSQTISFGGKVGIPITEPFSSKRSPYDLPGIHDERSRLLFGPSVEFRFTPRFSFEVNALFQRLAFDYNYDYQFPEQGLTQIHHSVAADRWTIPLMAKYRFAERKGMRPFVSLGGAVSIVDRVRGGSEIVRPDGTRQHSGSALQPSQHVTLGGVAAAGLELGSGRIKYMPEFRYTRWSYRQYDFGGPLRSNRNQVDFMFGIRF